MSDLTSKTMSDKLASFMPASDKFLIKSFCEAVNDLACENMLQPPYKLEGQHKRAMVILTKMMIMILRTGRACQRL